MKYAGLIKEDEDGNLTYESPETNEEISKKEDQHEKHESVTLKPITKEEKGAVSSVTARPQLVLGIMITPEMSEEQIRKCIRIVIDEWKKLSESVD